jgi:hypothetical protein
MREWGKRERGERYVYRREGKRDSPGPLSYILNWCSDRRQADSRCVRVLVCSQNAWNSIGLLLRHMLLLLTTLQNWEPASYLSWFSCMSSGRTPFLLEKNWTLQHPNKGTLGPRELSLTQRFLLFWKVLVVSEWPPMFRGWTEVEPDWSKYSILAIGFTDSIIIPCRSQYSTGSRRRS